VSIGWGGLYATIAGELGGKELAGVATGVSSAILIIGVIIGPPLFGYIVDRTESFQIAWSVMAVSGLFSLLFAFLIREHERQM
jgi:cyanate permease